MPDPGALAPIVRGVIAGLGADDRTEVERASAALAAGIARQLGVRRVSVRVLATRPSSATEELHGLYVREDDRTTPVIHVWMRTAAMRKVVSPRTFLRTLLHEVCHHLDYELYRLADSFHTEGFFKRESSLVRTLVPERAPAKKRTPAKKRAPEPRRAEAAAPKHAASRTRARKAKPEDESRGPEQLDLGL